jgi:hypothetical protein
MAAPSGLEKISFCCRLGAVYGSLDFEYCHLAGSMGRKLLYGRPSGRATNPRRGELRGREWGGAVSGRIPMSRKTGEVQFSAP